MIRIICLLWDLKIFERNLQAIFGDSRILHVGPNLGTIFELYFVATL